MLIILSSTELVNRKVYTTLYIVRIRSTVFEWFFVHNFSLCSFLWNILCKTYYKWTLFFNWMNSTTAMKTSHFHFPLTDDKKGVAFCVMKNSYLSALNHRICPNICFLWCVCVLSLIGVSERWGIDVTGGFVFTSCMNLPVGSLSYQI